MTCVVWCHRDTDAHSRWNGDTKAVGASLELAASGVSRAWAWACVLCWPGRAGGGPIRAPSQNLPLSLVTAASLLCLAQGQPPHTHIPAQGGAALPSRCSRLGALVGRGLSKPQFLHLKTGRPGPFVPSDPPPHRPPDPGTTTSREQLGLRCLRHPIPCRVLSAAPQCHLGCAPTVRSLPLGASSPRP